MPTPAGNPDGMCPFFADKYMPWLKRPYLGSAGRCKRGSGICSRLHGSSVGLPDAEHILLQLLRPLLRQHLCTHVRLACMHAAAVPLTQPGPGTFLRGQAREKVLQGALQGCLTCLRAPCCSPPAVECPACMGNIASDRTTPGMSPTAERLSKVSISTICQA